MQKIFNWTVGSFFRSIGHFIAYVVIGGFIAYLLHSTTDIRLADLLGIQRVSALSLDGSYAGLVQVNDNDQILSLYENQFSSGISFKYPYTANQGYEYLVFGYSGVFGVEQTNDPDTINYNYYVERFGLTMTLTASNGGGYNTACEIQNNMIVCPIKPNGIYNGIYVTMFNGATYTDSSPEIRISITAYPTLYNVDGTQDVINAQNQTTNAVNSMNQTISDTNSTSESNQASDFFHDYNETAQDGIIAIVNMPLNIFNALTLGSTQDLCFNLKGKQVCLPSGDMIWGKTNRTSIHSGNATFTPHPFSAGGSMSEPLTLFKGLFNLVVGGYLCYKMLKSLMRITNDMLNPTKDKLEVLDL